MANHQAAPESGAGSGNDRHHQLHESCITHTASALRESGTASHEEIESALLHFQHSWQATGFQDLIELIAIARGGDDMALANAAVLEMGEGVASSLATPPALVPFAGKLITPTAFYNKFTAVRAAAAHLHCPILFAEDNDAVGTGSINPVAAVLMADFIETSVHSLTGIKPFVTAVRMDYPSWMALNRKHFES